MRHLALVLFSLAAVVVSTAVARTRTTQRQLHSAAAVVQTIDSADVDSIDLAVGVNPDGIIMKGFTKRASDTKESFFITSQLSHRISSVRLLMRYMTMDGSVLHQRRFVVPVDLKPGETKMVSVKSFDTQRRYYYFGGNKPRKSAIPFKVAYRLTGYDIPVGN